MRQITSAINYMHQIGVAHRDLKPENLLVDLSGTVVKVTDFGASKSFEGSAMTTKIGTPNYLAPEIYNASGVEYGASVDIWSLGVIAYIVLCGYSPWEDPDENVTRDTNEIICSIMTASYIFYPPDWGDVESEAKDFIKQILVADPEERPTASQLMVHPWLLIDIELTTFRESDAGPKKNTTTTTKKDKSKKKHHHHHHKTGSSDSSSTTKEPETNKTEERSEDEDLATETGPEETLSATDRQFKKRNLRPGDKARTIRLGKYQALIKSDK